MKLVLFGAGNIGRSFIAPLFSEAGYEVVFIDINPTLLSEINGRGQYPVITVETGKPPQTRDVPNVRAVDGRDADAVTRELATATLAATAVGKGALPAVARSLALGLADAQNGRKGTLDVILAENVRECARVVSTYAEEAVEGVSSRLGLVETSIGKMVPIVPPDQAAKDPLIVYAEPYNTLIMDKHGFKGELPEIANLKAVERIDAYVDRKLFIHNLGHAAAAYVGYARNKEMELIADAVEDPAVHTAARQAMKESADGLLAAYPEVFSKADLEEHINDLLHRFGNKALGDTVHRVGRDLPRKLGRDDRLVGAMRLCATHSLPFSHIAEAYKAALEFDCPDATGAPFPADTETVAAYRQNGIEWILREISGLAEGEKADDAVFSELVALAP